MYRLREIAGREEEVAGLQDELESIRLQLAHSKSQLQQTEGVFVWVNVIVLIKSTNRRNYCNDHIFL